MKQRCKKENRTEKHRVISILKKEIGEINWIQECITAFITSLIFLLVTTAFFWIISVASSGEYTGEKQEEYLKKQIIRDIGVTSLKNIKSTNILRATENLPFKDQIVMLGEYSTEEKSSNKQWNGRFIYIFERKAENFWNRLTGVKPKYVASFSRISQSEWYDNYTLLCSDVSYDDIDGDGIPEILVLYESKYADRSSKTQIYLQKIKNKWKLISADFSGLEEEMQKYITNDGVLILIDEYQFEDPKQEKKNEKNIETTYGLSHHGDMWLVENPIWGGTDWLYCIAVNDGSTSLISTDKSAYVMMRVTNHGLFREPNWNDGEILYIPENEFQYETISEKWGYRIGNTVFYGKDVE